MNLEQFLKNILPALESELVVHIDKELNVSLCEEGRQNLNPQFWEKKCTTVILSSKLPAPRELT